MSESSPDRGVIGKAEETILRIKDVRSCRITTDDEGAIAEVHVVAAAGRQPKMIARDVESVLKAELGLSVDYRKIGVVAVDLPPGDEGRSIEEGGKPGEADTYFEDTDILIEDRLSEEEQGRAGFPSTLSASDSGPQLEFLEDSTRIGFRGVTVDISGDTISAEVRLGREGIEVTGRSEGAAVSAGVPLMAARAAVDALAELLDEDFHLCLSGVSEIDIAGREAFAVVVEAVGGRASTRFSGCAMRGRDPGEAAVLAVLDAVNRPLGRWKTRRDFHYRIL